MNVPLTLPHPRYLALTLSHVVYADASDMVTHLNDEETVKYLIGPPYPMSIEQIRNYTSSRPSVNGHCLALAIRDHGRMIGEIGIEPMGTPGTYELGYYLSRPYWNNGIVSIAVKTYLDVIVKRISAGEDITIEAAYLIDNIASGRVLKKCGFVEVGHDEKIKNGQKFHSIKLIKIIPDKEQATGVNNSYN
jgi:RimJ/RimL family protein N-acetyltransferase